jgi:phosphoribosylamine---glycine ligase
VNVLIIGSGGREHALAWKISKSPLLTKLYCCPGNAGTYEVAENIGKADEDSEYYVNLAQEFNINLTIVGPEKPLANGIVDAFDKAGLLIFGPSKKAARLEYDKSYAKLFMEMCEIPTAPFSAFSDYRDAIEYIDSKGRTPLVVKASGLCGGKGVFVCTQPGEAKSAVKDLMVNKIFGDAGSIVVIEDRLFGSEASFFCLTDGVNVRSLGFTKDYKRLMNGDKGPNTGGMGAVSPAFISEKVPDIETKVLYKIVYPLLEERIRQGTLYKGLLYVGLMIVNGEPYVLEFNCRFGDPETQALLRRIKGDLLPALLQVAEGRLSTYIELCDEVSVCVVMVSSGYPVSVVDIGKYIWGLSVIDTPEDVEIFLAGVRRNAYDEFFVNGGRVINITATGTIVEDARYKAYRVANEIGWNTEENFPHYRTDIGIV